MLGKEELRWGAIIGGANLLWLWGSFYLGMHTNGLAGVQLMSLISVLISVVGYVFALRAVHRREPEMTWLEGVRCGAVVAGVVALFAVVAQVGYFFLIHPEWTEYMVEETGKYFREQGSSEEEVKLAMEAARDSFSFRSYLLQAAVGALVIGMLSTAVIMAILTRGKRR